MARKRSSLSDLLRQEAQKSPEAEVEVTPEAPVDQPAPAEAAAPATPAPNPIAELEATIAQLQQALTEAQKREQTLQKTIGELEAELASQQQQLQTVQENLAKANRLHPELEEAKRAALQLAEANQRLTREIADLRKPTNGHAPAPISAPPSPPPAVALASDASAQRYAVTLLRPIQANEKLPSYLSDRDISWVD